MELTENVFAIRLKCKCSKEPSYSMKGNVHFPDLFPDESQKGFELLVIYLRHGGKVTSEYRYKLQTYIFLTCRPFCAVLFGACTMINRW